MNELAAKLVAIIEDDTPYYTLVDYPGAYFDDITEDTFVSTFISDISNSNKSFEYNIFAVEKVIGNCDIPFSELAKLI